MDIGTISKISLISIIYASLIFTGQDTFHVDILKGAYFYWHFVGDVSLIHGQGPTAVNSKLGYLISGPLESVRV